MIGMGSRVTLHLELRLQDGMVVESTFGDEPLSLVLGDGTLDRGLELALLGLRAGDRQTLTLMPGQAFGTRDQAAVQVVERARFPRDMSLEPGQIIGFTTDEGEELAAAVVAVDGDEVTVDFNHPLAGRQIEFEVEILSTEAGA
ncbi:MAG TPA: peptidylprolyl isomerase [Gammaproteobacteria bacterium]|nr:peptidylprolyl isomerase [Gammaproteobacteria bacterium]